MTRALLPAVRASWPSSQETKHKMCESFYGLTDKTLQLNPAPSFLFGSRQHWRAKACLDYVLYESEGFIVIAGEIGAGKSTSVRSQVDKLDPGTVVAAELVGTQLVCGYPAHSISGLRPTDHESTEVRSTAGTRCVLAITQRKGLAGTHHRE